MFLVKAVKKHDGTAIASISGRQIYMHERHFYIEGDARLIVLLMISVDEPIGSSFRRLSRFAA